MKILSFVFVLLFVGTSISSKGQTVSSGKGLKIGTVKPHLAEDKWNATLQHLEMPVVFNGEKKIHRLPKITVQKNASSADRKHQEFNNTLGNDVFEEVRGFEGNPYNFRIPNDNTLAISNDGILITAINSQYMVYDTNEDTLMDEGSLNKFIEDMPEISRGTSKYDPKLTYDQDQDRFILTFLVGTTSNLTKVILCLSATNNPIDGWNVYVLEGDALNTGHWTDYPAIAVNKEEILITGNLLVDNESWQTGFHQSIIWQVDKWAGYEGKDDISFKLWSDIKENGLNIRNIHPVKGAQKLQSSKQYFLSNKNFSVESDTIYLITIENTALSGNETMTVKLLSTPDHYFLGPNAKQSIDTELQTNDSRVLGAITDADWIQFVQNSADTAHNTSAVYHGFIRGIDDLNPTLSGVTISNDTFDIGYPNIASTATILGGEECVIGFNFSSAADTNGIACVYQNNFQEYSDIIKLYTGDEPIKRVSSGPDRWGDYFGIQRKFNEPCNIWMTGMFGGESKNGSWVSSVRTEAACEDPFASISVVEKKEKAAKIIPNPVHDIAHFDFFWGDNEEAEVSVIDAQGKELVLIYKGLLKAGNNSVSFFVEHLSPGTYFIQVNGKNNNITEPLVIVGN